MFVTSATSSAWGKSASFSGFTVLDLSRYVRDYFALFVPDLLIFCVLMLSLVWASFRGPALLLMASLSLSISPAWATISLTVLSSRS